MEHELLKVIPGDIFIIDNEKYLVIIPWNEQTGSLRCVGCAFSGSLTTGIHSMPERKITCNHLKCDPTEEPITTYSYQYRKI